MTVAELITRLQALPQDQPVVLELTSEMDGERYAYEFEAIDRETLDRHGDFANYAPPQTIEQVRELATGPDSRPCIVFR